MILKALNNDLDRNHVVHDWRHQLLKSALILRQRDVSQGQIFFKLSYKLDLRRVENRFVDPTIAVHARNVIVDLRLIELGSVILLGLSDLWT